MTSSRTFRAWLSHAFSLGPTHVTPTSEQIAAVERVCDELIRRDMARPALLWLDSSRPLNFFAAQTLQFLQPLLGWGPAETWRADLAEFLEQRGSIEYLCTQLEARLQVQSASVDPSAETERTAEPPAEFS